MRSLALVVLAACGSTPKAPKEIEQPPAPAPAAPAPVAVVPVAEPAPPPPPVEEPVGAVPIPDESKPPPIEQIDTTVTDDEVLRIGGWPVAKKSARKGEVWIAVHGTDKQELLMSVVGDDQGRLADYTLGPATLVTNNDTFDGNTYPARDHVGDYQGPILFAFRVTVPGAQSAIDQVVVFRNGTSLRAARRPLGGKDWKPVVQVAFGKGTTFRGIGTTDPH